MPAREREPRHIHPNFYWLQEDHLRQRRHGQDWRWTIFRPQIIFGFAVGSLLLAPSLFVLFRVFKGSGSPSYH